MNANEVLELVRAGFSKEEINALTQEDKPKEETQKEDIPKDETPMDDVPKDEKKNNEIEELQKHIKELEQKIQKRYRVETTVEHSAPHKSAQDIFKELNLIE